MRHKGHKVEVVEDKGRFRGILRRTPKPASGGWTWTNEVTKPHKTKRKAFEDAKWRIGK